MSLINGDGYAVSDAAFSASTLHSHCGNAYNARTIETDESVAWCACKSWESNIANLMAKLG